MPKYRAAFVPGEPNIKFWLEVFVGRVITDVVFDDKGGIEHLILDNGEILWCTEDGQFSISDNEDDDDMEYVGYHGEGH